jgi:transglutaminase 1
MKPVVWKYSQYEKDVLDCCLHLVSSIGKVALHSRNDPIKVTRAMSAAVRYSISYRAITYIW